MGLWPGGAIPTRRCVCVCGCVEGGEPGVAAGEAPTSRINLEKWVKD